MLGMGEALIQPTILHGLLPSGLGGEAPSFASQLKLKLDLGHDAHVGLERNFRTQGIPSLANGRNAASGVSQSDG